MGVGFTGELKTLVRTGGRLLQASNEFKEAHSGYSEAWSWEEGMKLILTRGLGSRPMGRSNWMKVRADQLEMKVGLGRNVVWWMS